jgi:hypothetical protein
LIQAIYAKGWTWNAKIGIKVILIHACEAATILSAKITIGIVAATLAAG